jgi:hypothetical protein
MESEDAETPPDLDTSWLGSAQDLAIARNWHFWRAFDHVLVKYLMDGDTRPLLDLIFRQKRTPSLRVGEYIAAMIDRRFLARFPDPNFPYEIRIKENRRPGRPRNGATARLSADECQQTLATGLRAIEEGRLPVRDFWLDLATAIDFDGSKRNKCANFPLRAELVRTDGRNGRRKDPSLLRRKFALAAFVAERMENGAKYDQAVEEVRTEIENVGKAQKWKGWVGSQTIRDAYDQVNPKNKNKE